MSENPAYEGPLGQADEVFASATPPPESGTERASRLAVGVRNQALLLQEKIKVGMPTKAEMLSGKPQSVTKQNRWRKSTFDDVVRYQEIRVEHHDLPSVEALRQP